MKLNMRGAGVALPVNPERVGLPLRSFLYTIDQICQLIQVEPAALKAGYLHFEGRSTGIRGRDLMIAVNIAPPDEKPEWRVSERELIRWLRYKGIRYYDTGVAQ